MTTGGGTTIASNLTVKTSGTSSAAIRSDRGGGTVKVNKGTYTTTGTGSPAIYCTSNTSVSNATLESKASEGIVIEGKNSVTLKNTKLTANNTKLSGKITVDDVSSLNIKLTKKSSFTGTINSSKQEGTVKVTVEKGSTCTLTGDSYVTSLTNNGTINTNGHTLYVNGVAYKG